MQIQRWVVIWMVALVGVIGGCGEDLGEVAQAALSLNACTAVKLTSPTPDFTAAAGDPIVLTGVATCPAGQTPEYQYWFKPLGAANWSHLPPYVPGSTTWTLPSSGPWCVSVVARAVGAPETYQARSSARCSAPRCGNHVIEAGEQCDDGNARDGDGCDASCTLTGLTYIKASNTGTNDFFGGAVALSADGTTLAVGAIGEASAATGVGGNQHDDSAPAAGAVYVFTRSGASWSQQAYLKASNSDAGDDFGVSLALSADGSTLVVGASDEASAATGVGGNQADDTAPLAGAAYVFTRSGATWTQQAYLKASNAGAGDRFGGSVAMTADGAAVAVGAFEEASAASGIHGNQADDSMPGAGAVYLFARSGATWNQQAYLKASNPDIDDGFGASLALSADGKTLAVGAASESSAATGIHGNQGDNSATQAGAVYVFARSGTTWTQEAYLKASNTDASDLFGFDVALSADGSVLAVGASGEGSAATGSGGNQSDNTAPFAGAVYVFQRSSATWSQQAYLKPSNTEAFDQFGWSLALTADGSSLAVSAVGEDSAATGIGGDQGDNSRPTAGAAYRFTRSGTTWSQQAYLKASNTGARDEFGYSVALSGDGAILAAGAVLEASAATGIAGDQADDSATFAGALYVFQ